MLQLTPHITSANGVDDNKKTTAVKQGRELTQQLSSATRQITAEDAKPLRSYCYLAECEKHAVNRRPLDFYQQLVE